MENEHFCKIIALFSKLHKIYFRSFCAKFAYELINVLINKSSIKMVNDLNLGVDKNGSMTGLDFQTHFPHQ